MNNLNIIPPCIIILREIHARVHFYRNISTTTGAIVFPIQNQGKWNLRKQNNQNGFILIFISYCSNFELQNILTTISQD